MKEMINRNSMHIWFPALGKVHTKLNSAIPKTVEVRSEEDLWNFFDGRKCESLPKLIDELWNAYQILKDKDNRAFLRHSTVSGKHGYKDSCFLNDIKDKKQFFSHFSEILDMAGIHDQLNLHGPDYWYVRQFIELKSYFKAFRGDLPIAPELRIFADNGTYKCCHFYWPLHALEDYCKESDLKLLPEISDESKKDLIQLKHDAQIITSELGGHWSVDFAKDVNGLWWLIDMARAEQSYHEFDDSC